MIALSSVTAIITPNEKHSGLNDAVGKLLPVKSFLMSNKVILGNSRAVLALIACLIMQLSLNQVDPTYTNHEWDEFIIPAEYQSFVYLIPYLSCILFSRMFGSGVLLFKVDRR